MKAYDRAIAAWGEGVPHDVLARIVAGESPGAIVCAWRGLFAAELARCAGLHRVQAHDIESGKRNGSLATMRSIAEALDVPLHDLA